MKNWGEIKSGQAANGLSESAYWIAMGEE